MKKNHTKHFVFVFMLISILDLLIILNISRLDVNQEPKSIKNENTAANVNAYANVGAIIRVNENRHHAIGIRSGDLDDI